MRTRLLQSTRKFTNFETQISLRLFEDPPRKIFFLLRLVVRGEALHRRVRVLQRTTYKCQLSGAPCCVGGHIRHVGRAAARRPSHTTLPRTSPADALASSYQSGRPAALSLPAREPLLRAPRCPRVLRPHSRLRSRSRGAAHSLFRSVPGAVGEAGTRVALPSLSLHAWVLTHLPQTRWFASRKRQGAWWRGLHLRGG